MAWEVEVTDEFKAWWSGLTDAERISVERAVLLLEERGPNLPFPYSSGVPGIFRHFDLLPPEYSFRAFDRVHAGNLDDLFVFILPASSGNASLDGLIGLRVNESRVSQIKQRALSKLRSHL